MRWGAERDRPWRILESVAFLREQSNQREDLRTTIDPQGRLNKATDADTEFQLLAFRATSPEREALSPEADAMSFYSIPQRRPVAPDHQVYSAKDHLMILADFIRR